MITKTERVLGLPRLKGIWTPLPSGSFLFRSSRMITVCWCGYVCLCSPERFVFQQWYHRIHIRLQREWNLQHFCVARTSSILPISNVFLIGFLGKEWFKHFIEVLKTGWWRFGLKIKFQSNSLILLKCILRSNVDFPEFDIDLVRHLTGFCEYKRFSINIYIN